MNDELIDLFITLKSDLTNRIDSTYPHLKLIKKEISNYKKEASSKFAAWKQGIIEELNYFDDNDFSLEIGEMRSPKPKANAKEIISEVLPTRESPVGFSSLGGMEKLKESFMDKIIFPIKNPETAKLDKLEYGKDFPRATLLVGPPGCGKTFIAEATAREADIPFYSLKIGKQGSIYVNGASLNLTSAFDVVEKRAKEINKPCILFLDELEGITPDRGKLGGSNDSKMEIVGTLLDLINSARSKGIILIGATNKHQIMDPAILSRFDNQEFVGLPDLETRNKILKKVLEGKTKAAGLLNSEEAINEIAIKLDKFSNRSIADLTNAAAELARKDGRRDIKIEDFTTIINKNLHQKITNEKEYLPGKQNNFTSVGYLNSNK